MTTSIADTLKDAAAVEERIAAVFGAQSTRDRAQAVRSLFTEQLDFDTEWGTVSLDGARGVELPADAHRAASVEDEVEILYIDFSEVDTDTNRIRKAEVDTAAKRIADDLGDDLLLVFTNRDINQLQLVHPKFDGARVTLRRMTVERDLPHRTACQQIAEIYRQWREPGKTLSRALDDAFNVEAVTKRFFTEYERFFKEAEGKIDGFGDDEEAKRIFTLTLFNRLMFVYFLSRKGWLTFKGDNDYLNALWEDYRDRNDEENFYNERLAPLFDRLQNEHLMDLEKHNPVLYEKIGEPPFLNGGLFAERKPPGVVVDDGAVRPVIRELFARFNFTVMESTPYDVEVAVDPEMLGKVFEELVNERNKSGAYYTPRPVVSYMCREALKGYIATECPALPEDVVAEFVDEHDTARLPVAEAASIALALERATVVDPACGSGAYLLGMMQELVDMHLALYRAGVTPKSLYELKLRIIERNLYGVDIDGFAVNIAMLRLWLSLAIDYEGEVEDIEQLPNLDFKIVRGDSLLGPDPNPDNYGDLFRSTVHEKADALAKAKADYFRATGSEKSNAIHAIRKAQDALTQALVDDTPVPSGTVDWRVDFADVFHRRGGFDVVLANPPYVVIKDSRLRALYEEGVRGRMNTYGLFIQRSLQLMRENGQLMFINPRTLLTDNYFSNLRRVIRQQAEIQGVVLIEDRHNTFARVLQECIILQLIRRTKPSDAYSVKARSVWRPVDLNDAKAYYTASSDQVLLGEEYDDAWYIGTSDFEYSVFQRMCSAGQRLVDLGFSAETGKLQFDKYSDFAQPIGEEDSCRLIWAENIQRYCLRESKRRIGKEWLSKEIVHLLPPNFSGQGIMTQRVSANEQARRIIATLIESTSVNANQVYSENHTNFISSKNPSVSYLFLLSVLNSSPVEYVFRHLNSNTQVSAGEISRLPLPPVPNAVILVEIETLVQQLLTLRGVDCEADAIEQSIAYERRIDNIVGSLYGLTDEEVEEIQYQLPSHEEVYGIGAGDEEEDTALAGAIEEALQEGRGDMEEVRQILREWDEARK